MSKPKQPSCAIIFSNYNPLTTVQEVLSFRNVDYMLQVSSSSLRDHGGVDEAILVLEYSVTMALMWPLWSLNILTSVSTTPAYVFAVVSVASQKVL